MATVRVKRIVGLTQTGAPTVRVKRIAGVVAASTGTVRVKRIVGVVTVEQPTVGVTVALSATPTLVWQKITMTASATLTGSGDSVASWSWTRVSTNAAPLSSTTTAAASFRVLAHLAATSYQYQVKVTSVQGATFTAVVTVPIPKAPMFTIDAAGVRHPSAWIGTSPTYPLPAVTGTKTVRVKRLLAIVQGSTSNPTPGPSGMLVGGRVNMPSGTSGTDNTEAGDFALGEQWYGPLQVTKDYFGGTLPAKYNSPFPARVVVQLSMSDPTSFTQANFAGFVKSIPAGTILTYQHEPERPQFSWNGPQYVTKLNSFCDAIRAIRTDCPIWIMSSGYQYKTGSSMYDNVKNGQYLKGLEVDGYGFEAYRNGTNNNAQGMAIIDIPDRNEFILWKSLIPSGATWGISETGFGRTDNSTVSDIVQQRNARVPTTVARLISMGCSTFMYFFSNEGPDWFPWLPTDDGFKAMYKALPRGSAS